MDNPHKWVVGSHGSIEVEEGFTVSSFEVFIARASNQHAFRSYGWSNGYSKIVLFSAGSGTPYHHTTLSGFIYLDTAQYLADRYNKEFPEPCERYLGDLKRAKECDRYLEVLGKQLDGYVKDHFWKGALDAASEGNNA